MTRPAIIITGGAKRVGAVLSRHFAQAGYDIALHYNSSKQEAQKLQAEITGLGAACNIFAHDLADSSGLASLMGNIHKAMPHCVALINNASVFERSTLMETNEALFDRQLDINFKAPFFLTQAFARAFGKGSVINVVDTEITQLQGSHFAYLLSKKMLAEFTLMAARELGPNIRVNGVCPGHMGFPGDAKDPYVERIRNEVPLKAHADVNDLAQAAHWLISQPHITGQLIFVDGGKHVL